MVPKRIKLAGENESLEVEWSDGHRSAYRYTYLRERCPCATCAGEDGAKPARPPGPLAAFSKPLKPDRAEPVGRYAIQIYWNDGHHTGIYTFDYLRVLCPCDACMAASADSPDAR